MNIRGGLILTGLMMAGFAGPAFAQDPEDDNYTDLAAVHLQEAQNNEDDVEAAASYERALEILLDGIADRPKNSKLYFYAGIAHLGLQHYAEADRMFDRAEEMFPEYLTEPDGTDLYRENGWIQAYNAGLEQLNAGNEAGAVEMFRNATMVYDRRPEAYLNLGNTLANTGESEQAIEEYGSAVAVIDKAVEEGHHEADLPTWAGYRMTALINMAQIMVRSDRAEEAVPILQGILDEDPDNSDARTNLAVAMAQSGQGGDATGIYDEIIQDPESSPLDVYNAGVGLYQAEHYAKAAEAFRVALEGSPMFRDALQNLTQALAQAARDDESLWETMPQYSAQLLEMDPNNDLAYRLHGIALARNGDSDTAIELSEEMEALPFTIQQLQLRPGQGVVGALVNRTLEEGEEVTLRFTFYDTNGDDIGNAEAHIAAPAQGAAEVLQAPFDNAAAAGYSYEVIGN
jgi:tetratricopeptide (TPR) repeat protein